MNNAIIKEIEKMGYSTIPEKFYTQVNLWKSWYVGKVKDFHRYRSYNGHKWVKRERTSLGMAKKVSEDWADLLMNEKVQITLEGKKEQMFINGIFAQNNFEVKANEMQELKAALGTGAYIPRVVGQTINSFGEVLPGTASAITLDYVTIEDIYPLSWHNGFISECAFTSRAACDGHDYLYMQIHSKDTDGLYVIENRIFRYDNEILTEERLKDVRGFETIPPLVHTGSDQRQFVIDRLNIANNVDSTLPVGVSVYANAIDVLRGVDSAYDCYLNEFENGALMLMVKMPATRWEDDMPTLDDNDRRFYLLPEDATQGNVIDPISIPLRTQQLNIGLQDQLNILSSKCGFGENHYRFDGGNISTATQVISENSTMFRTLKKHEVILESVLVELCRILLRLGNTAMGMGLNEDVEISVDFDDSIIESREQNEARIYQMLNAGLMKAEEARSILMNEDIETARKNLPGMEDMATEEEAEVE